MAGKAKRGINRIASTAATVNALQFHYTYTRILCILATRYMRN